MCGIVGIVDFATGHSVDKSDIERMCNTIVHRGPDDVGTYSDANVGIGMRRLSIIDVDGGRQPIQNEDESIWIVFNGEIYNYQELRSSLKHAGHQFRTKTDTETIIHLYEEYGIECLQHLRGMFAFAIWDKNKRQLFVARDRLGIKPLFWAHDGNRFIFASEIKAILANPNVPRIVDWTAVDAYFAYTYIPAPLSIYKSIRKLPCAHYMVVRDGKVSVQRYWDLDFSGKNEKSEKDIAGEFRDLLQESVGMRMMSEVPLGSFLSGGVDSSLIVALMSAKSEDPIQTFTIGFGGERGEFLDERPYARELSNRYQCRHNEIEVLPQIETALKAGLSSFDEPFADDSVIPTYHICEAAREHVTVLLTGLGGDENFAGYERYLGLWMSRYYEKLPSLLRDKVLRPLVMRLKEQKGGHYRINHIKRFVSSGGLSAGRRYQRYICSMPPESRKRLYSEEIRSLIDFDYVESLGWEHFNRLDEADLLDRALYQDMNMYLPEDILALSDRIGMYHSLELRVPFVDHKLVEYCAKIPSNLKIRRMNKKYLLKEVGRDLLPRSVLSHRKQGFCSPMAVWLRGDLKDTVDKALAGPVIEDGGVFDPDTIGSILKDHHERRTLNDKVIFSLLVFQKWMAEHERSETFAEESSKVT